MAARRKKWRPCSVSGCPNLTLNSRCDEHRYPRPQGRRWMRLRRAKLRANPKCELREADICTIWATEVDHIVPLVDGGNPWDWDNLQSACHECHARKTAEEQRRLGYYDTHSITGD